MAPEPVPMSRILSGAVGSEFGQDGFDEEFGFGAGDQDDGGDVER